MRMGRADAVTATFLLGVLRRDGDGFLAMFFETHDDLAVCAAEALLPFLFMARLSNAKRMLGVT